MRRKKISYILLAVTSVVTVNTMQAQTRMTGKTPRLVVSVIIDNLTTSSLDRYSAMYGNDGFARLSAEGVIYNNVSCPFDGPDLISSAAAIMTGTTPYYNGITGRQRLDRNTLRPTDSMGDTPEALQVSTITDELKVATGGQAVVYAVAEDKATAMITGGHAADAALWTDERGGWNSVKYYNAGNTRWVTAYNRVTSTSATADRHDMLTDMAVQCVASGGMGTDDVSDMLTVTYDVEDTEESYFSLDRNIGSLISRIEDAVGKERVLFIITGTGHKEEEAADYERYRIPTGMFYINRTVNLLNMFLSATYGQGRYAETSFGNQIFLNKKLIEQRKISLSEILNRSKNFVMELSGVRNVTTSEEIMNNRCPDERVRNAYNPAVCGDLIIETAPGWSIVDEDTGFTSQPRVSLVTFPLIFIGGGCQHRVTDAHVSIDAIAPTIADIIHIRAPNACRTAPVR